MLDLSDPTVQVAYYDPGVGTLAAAGAWTPFARWWSKVMGLAFGSGLRENLGEAYCWLMQNWEQGDQVYVSGFSRGAYNARALLGLLRTLGLMRPGSENFVLYAVAAYSGGCSDMHLIAEVFAQRVDTAGHTTVPVRYLGVWDTVNRPLNLVDIGSKAYARKTRRAGAGIGGAEPSAILITSDYLIPLLRSADRRCCVG